MKETENMSSQLTLFPVHTDAAVDIDVKADGGNMQVLAQILSFRHAQAMREEAKQRDLTERILSLIGK